MPPYNPLEGIQPQEMHGNRHHHDRHNDHYDNMDVKGREEHVVSAKQQLKCADDAALVQMERAFMNREAIERECRQVRMSGSTNTDLPYGLIPDVEEFQRLKQIAAALLKDRQAALTRLSLLGDESTVNEDDSVEALPTKLYREITMDASNPHVRFDDEESNKESKMKESKKKMWSKRAESTTTLGYGEDYYLSIHTLTVGELRHQLEV